MGKCVIDLKPLSLIKKKKILLKQEFAFYFELWRFSNRNSFGKYFVRRIRNKSQSGLKIRKICQN